jgi:hypothetical protein
VRVRARSSEGGPNPQLAFYAAAALESRVFGLRTQQVTLAIIQPGQRPVLDTLALPVSKLHQFAGRVRKAVEQGESASPPMAAGVYCDWCPAFAGCRERSKGLKLLDPKNFRK